MEVEIFIAPWAYINMGSLYFAHNKTEQNRVEFCAACKYLGLFCSENLKCHVCDDW